MRDQETAQKDAKEHIGQAIDALQDANEDELAEQLESIHKQLD